MSPVRRAAVTVLLLLAAAASICAQAQSQTAASPSASQKPSGPKKPVPKNNQVPNKDPVVQLGVKRPQPAPGSPGEGAVETAQAAKPADQNTAAAAEDTQKKAAEIASLETQIQDKTKKIAFLMRLFVNDERPFLNDPANRKVDESAQDRRKYEQDELLWETAELAKLKARLNELTAAK